MGSGRTVLALATKSAVSHAGTATETSRQTIVPTAKSPRRVNAAARLQTVIKDFLKV